MSKTGLSSQDSDKLRDVGRIFGTSLKVYKDLQILYSKIDDRIQNEYCYCARAQETIIGSIIDSRFDDNFYDALENYSSAAKHALNDSLDLVFAYAKIKADELSEICEYTTIGDVYTDYNNVTAIFEKYAETISLSREERGMERIEAYIKMAEDEEYKTLNKFCLNIKTIKKDLRIKRRKELNTARKDLGMLVVGILAIVATIIIGLVTALG